MFDDEEHDCEDETDAPRPWSWMRLAAVSANLAGNVSKSMWAFFDDIKDACNGHVAVDDDRRDAWHSLHADLEALPTFEE